MFKKIAMGSMSVFVLTVLILFYQNFTVNMNVLEQPNIIYIMLDDAGYADFTNPEIYKPTIDKLERKALKFTHFYTNPTCSPTRISIMTGRNPARFGIEHAVCLPESNVPGGTARGIPRTMETIPKELAKVGYHSVHIGKWHLGERVSKRAADQGFDETIVYNYDNHGFYDPLIHTYDKNRLVSSMKILGHKTNILTNKALQFIKRHDKRKPFFLNLWYNDPHGPNQPESHWIAKYTNQLSALPPHRRDKVKYYGALSQVDYNIGRIIKEIEADPYLSQNTIIFLTSDNGGAPKPGNYSNHPLKGRKGHVFEGGIRVPLYAYWPGVLKGAHKNKSLLRSSDMFSTIIELANGQDVQGVESESFVDLLLDGRGGITEKERGNTMFWHQRTLMKFCGPLNDFLAQKGWLTQEGWKQAIRRKNWKYISTKEGGVYKEYLYDFSQTESEEDDFNLVLKNPIVLNRMRSALDRIAVSRSRIPLKIKETTGDVLLNGRTLLFGSRQGRAQLAPHDLYENHDGSFTFGLKIKPSKSLKGKASVLAQRVGSWELWLQSDRKIRLDIVDEESGRKSSLMSRTALTLGTEYNIVFTIAGNVGGPKVEQVGACLESTFINNVVRLYVQVSTETVEAVPEAINAQDIYNVAFSGYANPIYIGRDIGNRPNTGFSGSIYLYGAHSLELTPRQLNFLFKVKNIGSSESSGDIGEDG